MTEVLFYLLVALLPVAAFSGYRLGRSYQTKKADQQRGGLSRRYFVGLNYLLNEEPDKAIDTFVKMLEVDTETVETHLALGNLFRKRGEVDRAIRVHQNLIARPTLPGEVRKLALLELGLDYMGAGLFDRAESIFKELISEPHHKTTSLQQLMLIYQQTKDWEKAVKVAEQLQAVDSDNHDAEIANFYCELANQQVEKRQIKPAFQSLKRALQIDSQCARANMMRIELALAEQQPKQAIKYIKELMKQNPAFVSEMLPAIESCYSQLKDPKGYRQFLESSIESGAGVSAILAYAEIMRNDTGDKRAAEFIASQLRVKPSLKGLLRLIELHIKHAQDSARPSLEILYEIVSRSFEAKPVYRCEHCGFGGKTLFWQCPSCKHWGSVKPIQGLEGE